MLIDLKSSQHLLTLWYSESISVVNIVNINDNYTYYVTEKKQSFADSGSHTIIIIIIVIVY